MPDREKVIKGLEICSEHGSWHGLDCEHNEAYKDCPYRGCETGCIVTIAKDALAMLKEQEAEIEKLTRYINGFSRDAIPVARCKDCKHGEKCNEIYLCGKSRGFGIGHEPDFLCADGEQRG